AAPDRTRIATLGRPVSAADERPSARARAAGGAAAESQSPSPAPTDTATRSARAAAAATSTEKSEPHSENDRHHSRPYRSAANTDHRPTASRAVTEFPAPHRSERAADPWATTGLNR